MATQLRSVVKTLTVTTDTANALNTIKKKLDLKSYEEVITHLLEYRKYSLSHDVSKTKK